VFTSRRLVPWSHVRSAVCRSRYKGRRSRFSRPPRPRWHRRSPGPRRHRTPRPNSQRLPWPRSRRPLRPRWNRFRLIPSACLGHRVPCRPNNPSQERLIPGVRQLTCRCHPQRRRPNRPPELPRRASLLRRPRPPPRISRGSNNRRRSRPRRPRRRPSLAPKRQSPPPRPPLRRDRQLLPPHRSPRRRSRPRPSWQRPRRCLGNPHRSRRNRQSHNRPRLPKRLNLCRGSSRHRNLPACPHR
jgi:ribonuclease E